MRVSTSILGAVAAAALSLAGCATPPAAGLAAHPAAKANGIVAMKSGYPFAETVSRLQADVRAKGIPIFDTIDQQALAAGAGITTRPSTLLVFGNPPLGTQFIVANPQSGIDWPVRLLVYEDATGAVWVEYTDFAHVARRHAIDTLDPQFRMASEVVASITSAVTTR